MNVPFAALNLIAVIAIAVVFLRPRLRERREAAVEVPPAIRPNRAGQELADVVTEWAKATGVLNPDGSVGEQPADSDMLTDERS